MKLQDIIRDAEILLDDVSEPKLWTREEYIKFANEAEREAAIRGRLLRDDSADICSIVLTAGDSTVDYDAKIILVIRAKLSSMTRPLIKKTTQDLDLGWPGWETATGGTDYYIEQIKSRQIRLVCPVKADDTLNLIVYRLPLVDMANPNDEPEIAEYHHHNLKYWMAKLAFEKDDSQTLDLERSAAMDARFTSIFGPRPSEYQLEHWRTRAPARTRAQFF